VIVVDTSVWVEALRRPASRVADILNQVLDADEVALALPVRLELLSGVAKRHRTALKRGLSALPILRPTDDTWSLIEAWVDKAGDRGLHVAVPDLLIAGLAQELDALIWTLDADFDGLEKIGVARLYEPPAGTKLTSARTETGFPATRARNRSRRNRRRTQVCTGDPAVARLCQRRIDLERRLALP
jgi:predicted nucleic acid-binding protein